MAIRLPLQVVLSSNNNDEVGAGSVNGTVNIPFIIPQDTDNIVLKLTATMAGGGVSAQLQTTDDGGTTWFSLGRTSIVSAATGDQAQWLSIPVISAGIQSSSVVAVGSVISGTGIGSAHPSAVGSGEITGMPVLSQFARVALQLQAGVTSSSILTQIKVNSQSASA